MEIIEENTRDKEYLMFQYVTKNNLTKISRKKLSKINY